MKVSSSLGACGVPRRPSGTCAWISRQSLPAWPHPPQFAYSGVLIGFELTTLMRTARQQPMTTFSPARGAVLLVAETEEFGTPMCALHGSQFLHVGDHALQSEMRMRLDREVLDGT